MRMRTRVSLAELVFLFLSGAIIEITRIINNSVVNTCDEKDREVIVMGRGVDFKAKEGSTIDEGKVEKIFRLESQSTMDEFKELFVSLPMKHVRISVKIISYAKEVLNRPINPSVCTTLTDHINSTLERYKQKMMFPNPLTRGVRNFYHAKYPIDEYAIAMIEKDLGVKLPVDEAASITLHTINAEYDTPMSDIIKVASPIQQVLGVVREYFSIEPNEQSLNYEGFVTHLRFLAQRVSTGEHMNLDNLEFQEVIGRLYLEKYACSQEIQALIKLRYRHQVTEEEVAYPALHIKHIRTE